MGDSSSGSSLTSRPLEDEPYYHGEISRDDVQQLVKKEGEFLVRVGMAQGKKRTIISVMKGTLKHFIVNRSREGHFYVEKKVFESINDLVRYHIATKQPLTENSQALLVKPIPKQAWEISHGQIKLEKKIGEGTFGFVYKGTIDYTSGKQEAALKVCQERPDQAHRMRFMKEAKAMRGYDHPNIIRIFGVSAKQVPLTLAMEFAPGGTLKRHLKKGTSTPAQKLKFCIEAGRGMDYLASQKCIHGDLKTENCLLDKNNILKISNYGVAKLLEPFVQPKPDNKTVLSVKSKAPEVMTKSAYSLKSDIWSYGILLWEIFSSGVDPYSGASKTETIRKVTEGKIRTMKVPDNMPASIAEMMKKCWEQNPDKRPSFSTIKQTFDRLSKAQRR